MSPERFTAFVVSGGFAALVAGIWASAVADRVSDEAIDVEQIKDRALLEDRDGWDVAMLRQGGAEHSVRRITGARDEAIDFAIAALSKMAVRRVRIWRNRPDLFEARADNEGIRYRREGPLVSGVLIKSA